MPRPSISDDRERFLAELKSVGGVAGNLSLKRKLGWDDARYWRTQGVLYEDELIERGRGKGGSVSVRKDRKIQSGKENNRAERALYDPALVQIQEKWSEFHEYDDLIAEVTAAQGRRRTGGTWTRPDVTAVATRTFEYIPHRVFDIISFEIKTAENVKVSSIYEAKSHRVFATRAIVLVSISEEKFANLSEADRILSAAKENQIGLILAPKISDFGTWIEKAPALRQEPDPREADRFIRKTLKDKTRASIIKWQK